MVGTVFPWQSVFFIVGLPGLAIALLMVTVRELLPRNSLHAGSGPGEVPLRSV